MNNPNAGPFTALAVALVSAILDALTAFHVFNFTDLQRTAVLAVLTAAVALGFYLYAVLHTWHVVTLAKLNGGVAVPPSAKARG